jgi:hypothetical protein
MKPTRAASSVRRTSQYAPYVVEAGDGEALRPGDLLEGVFPQVQHPTVVVAVGALVVEAGDAVRGAVLCEGDRREGEGEHRAPSVNSAPRLASGESSASRSSSTALESTSRDARVYRRW